MMQVTSRAVIQSASGERDLSGALSEPARADAESHRSSLHDPLLLLCPAPDWFPRHWICMVVATCSSLKWVYHDINAYVNKTRHHFLAPFQTCRRAAGMPVPGPTLLPRRNGGMARGSSAAPWRPNIITVKTARRPRRGLVA